VTRFRFALAAGLLVASCARAPETHVLVLEASGPGAARRAGLRAGDLLASWERGGESGALGSPFASAQVEIEQAPRGPVTLRGRRGWRALTVTLPPGAWGLAVRPALAAPALADFETARAAQAKADAASSARAWQSLAERLAGDAAAWALTQAGRSWSEAHQPEPAARAFESAQSALGPNGAWRAIAADQAGDAQRAAGRTDEAESSYRRGLDLRTAIAPRSLAVALSHQHLSRVARRRGDLDAARSHLETARGLREELAPGSAELALAWYDLGATAYARGQIESAAAAYQQALQLQERVVPQGLDLANTLSALGGVASQRGDFGQAEALQKRALGLTERLAPDAVEHAYVLNRLGVVTREQGDLDEAETYHQRALAVFEKALPESLEVAGSLNNLGLVAQARKDWAAAERFHQRALAIREARSPRSADVAASLNNLGAVAREREDLAAAERYLQRSFEMKRALAPGSLTLGASLHNLGEVLLGQHKLAEARARFREALEVRARLAPGSADEATDWHSLGLVDLEEGRAAEALAKWTKALDIMDAQRGKLGTGDRAGFTARYAILYQDPIALLMEQKRYGEAFAVRERMQARALLALLGHRDSGAAPLDLSRTRAALDPGVALLAYGLLRRGTAVFVVRAKDAPGPAVSAFVSPLGDAELRDRVVAFRGLIERGRESSALEPALLAQGERLYADLVKPAEAALAGAERILISPDGALHLLPFAALVRERQPLAFLAEWKPLPIVASASVYATLKKTRRAAPDPDARLAAFGDPAPLPGAPAAARSGGPETRLRPLPYSREEVERIAALFGPRARRFLGAEATEAQALAVGRDVRYLHFATHGVLDPRSPLDSALVLAPPPAGSGADNGLLQAWEVRDRLHLDADLVTLSACESGLGREAQGEGLIGLARAFQHAGARSVLASLWAIQDQSTARFMESFYARLRAGAARDRALQEAQVASLRQGAHPYQWAAFQLSGDWQ
jgi:CHAT domain-containing protein/Tfp pilus assembly protein PilF